jgi:hypothetical protein
VFELDLLTRLRVQREEREQAQGQIQSEFGLLIGMTQAIIATAHPQDVAAQNMLWELHGRDSPILMQIFFTFSFRSSSLLVQIFSTFS